MSTVGNVELWFEKHGTHAALHCPPCKQGAHLFIMVFPQHMTFLKVNPVKVRGWRAEAMSAPTGVLSSPSGGWECTARAQSSSFCVGALTCSEPLWAVEAEVVGDPPCEHS